MYNLRQVAEESANRHATALRDELKIARKWPGGGLDAKVPGNLLKGAYGKAMKAIREKQRLLPLREHLGNDRVQLTALLAQVSQ